MTEEILEDPKAAARSIKLVYVNDSTPGITRVKNGKGFKYLDKNEEVIKDDETIARIKSLVLPPAWEEVWICHKANGHLQATGKDKRGRKQYRYHEKWVALRNETKFFRLYEFGKKLPKIRKQIKKDIRKKSLAKDKVIAIALELLEKSMIRVGNSYYEKEYGSYGLTTLKDKHVKIKGGGMKIKFKGKKGVMQEIEVRERHLARLVKKCRDIPGQELFQYYDEDGELHSLDSGHINEYLHEVAGEEFTAKDFRTWAGTVNAIKHFSDLDPCDTKTQIKKNIVQVVDLVAGQLGNTRSVCRKYYVHPAILEAYEVGELKNYLEHLCHYKPTKHGLRVEEKLLLKFLKDIKSERLKKLG